VADRARGWCRLHAEGEDIYYDALPGGGHNAPSAILVNRFEWFAIDYQGLFVVHTPGVLRFRLSADDGAKLFIDDNLVANIDGIHPLLSAEGALWAICKWT